MSLTQIIKTELYKNSHRKSSLILFLPMVLTVIVTLGYAQGVIELNLITGGSGTYSCMDFVFIVWNVLSGLGILGILMILFAALQFSGEIERGKIKFMYCLTDNSVPVFDRSYFFGRNVRKSVCYVYVNAVCYVCHKLSGGCRK